MTLYHETVTALAMFGAGFFCALMYAKYGLGWVPAFEAQIRSDIARMMALLEQHTPASVLQEPGAPSVPSAVSATRVPPPTPTGV
jgi:hypothetical protein